MRTYYEGEAKKLAHTFCQRMGAYEGVGAHVYAPDEYKWEGLTVVKTGRRSISSLTVTKKFNQHRSIEFVYRLKGAPFTAELLMQLEQEVIAALSLIE